MSGISSVVSLITNIECLYCGLGCWMLLGTPRDVMICRLVCARASVNAGALVSSFVAYASCFADFGGLG